MAANERDIADLVGIFLPLDADAVDSAFENSPGIELLAASLASFSVAADRTVRPMNRDEQLEFCRQVAAKSAGEVQAWMVEAALRSVEGDQDALAGTDSASMVTVHLYGIVLLSDSYLTAADCGFLRPSAIKLAHELLPRLAALPADGGCV
ncbi:hypothetical protein GCM10022223_43540 [Kineosporia mesophila]|uniref:TetR family transcriptional regulator n=1 Tax=Kineosporia mesophila TaxID=566012 RepID=A0ABP6ZX36_9ACTN|nr:hypothetical protein [Kineosporia mesophila]MCD5353217.1 hypothetical protein [Kineosporia mesophila]